MKVAASVAAAIAGAKPVVALESTIIAHGFPSPRNREIATDMEKAVAAAGALSVCASVDGAGCWCGQVTGDQT